jgi:dephospho-CoA kinase
MFDDIFEIKAFKMKIVGITGGIGGGKSTLSKLLLAEGFQVYNTDMEARRLQNESPVIRNNLIELFGTEVYDGAELNRKYLANIVFNSPELLQQLNAIVHPVVKNDFLKWSEQFSAESYVFMECAILFEGGFNSLVDKIILVTASEEVRIARVVKRDMLTVDQVKARIRNQMSDEQKSKYADYIIKTDDNQDMYSKMKQLLLQLSQQK